jgi:uncharacterized iron-regulated membrane protein
MRFFFVLVHRYIGLVMAFFLIVAGLTGMVLAFYLELDDWVNRDIMQVEPPTLDAKLLSPLVLRGKVQQQFSDAWVNSVNLQVKENHASIFALRSPQDPQHQHITSFIYDEAFVNPYTGKVIAARKWGDISQGMINFIPFIYTLHFELALGNIGAYVFGIVALLWTIDCFVGAYLTFPASRKDKSKPYASWAKRWQKSWKVRWNKGTFKLNFDLHRAGGLWIWVMLLIVAWSSVGFNLNQVYSPAMSAVFDFQAVDEKILTLKKPQSYPLLDFDNALVKAGQLMQAEAKSKDFTIIHSERLSYDPYRAVYQYRVKSSLDINEKVGQTAIYIDANTGKQLAIFLPSTKASGDTVNGWLMYLHTAKVWGLAFQIFVFFVGLMVTVLSVTGVYIWWKKTKARLKP